jgi:hypothetical protein
MKVLTRLVAIACLAHFCGPLAAQTTAPAPAAPAQQNLVAEAARGLGITTCLPAITRLAALATAGSRSHDILVDWDRAQPDRGAFFTLLGVNFGGQSVAATMTVIPQGDNGCTISAERISVAPYTCRSIADVELKGYTATSLLPTFTVYTLASDPGSSVSLLDSPPNCLVIRRYVQYGWKDPAAARPPAR